MKINNIDLNTLSDSQLKQLCLKYQIVQQAELQTKLKMQQPD